jgi:hypothetical protein
MSLLRVFLGVVILSLLFARPVSGLRTSSASPDLSAGAVSSERGSI